MAEHLLTLQPRLAHLYEAICSCGWIGGVAERDVLATDRWEAHRVHAKAEDGYLIPAAWAKIIDPDGTLAAQLDELQAEQHERLYTLVLTEIELVELITSVEDRIGALIESGFSPEGIKDETSVRDKARRLLGGTR